MADANNNVLGSFLKDRRARIDPVAFGYPMARRRTPGLRREEVAQRADVSATWYTWLEQGRNGAPSSAVLERLANALQLTVSEREHLHLIAGRQPRRDHPHAAPEVTPRMQRMLDSLTLSPAIIKTSAWDIVGWNIAAARVLTDYADLRPEERNVVRLIFGKSSDTRNEYWNSQARLVVASLRLQTTRTGSSVVAHALVADMCRSSSDFDRMWNENDVASYGEGTKYVDHPVAGPIVLEFETFAVDAQPDLSMVIYTPAGPADTERVRSLVTA